MSFCSFFVESTTTIVTSNIIILLERFLYNSFVIFAVSLNTFSLSHNCSQRFTLKFPVWLILTNLRVNIFALFIKWITARATVRLLLLLLRWPGILFVLCLFQRLQLGYSILFSVNNLTLGCGIKSFSLLLEHFFTNSDMLFKCSFLEFPSTTFRTFEQLNFFSSIYFPFHLHQLLIEFPIFIERNVFILIVVHIDDFHFTRFLDFTITTTLRLITRRISSSSWDIVIIDIFSWFIIFSNFLLLIIIEIIIFSTLFWLRLLLHL